MSVDRAPVVVVTHWVHQDVLDRLGEFCRPVAPSREQGVWDRHTIAGWRAAQGLVVCVHGRPG
jgi:hypothetical protein